MVKVITVAKINRPIDVKLEAHKIVQIHTSAFMSSTGDYKPKDDTELWETMTDECSFILTEAFLNGEYTPMEYNDIRNEIANLLGDIFSEFV